MNKGQTNKSMAVSLVYLHIFPLILFLSLEILNVSIYGSKYSYIVDNIPALVISCIFIYTLTLLVYVLSGNMFLSCMLTSLVLMAFYIVNFYRRIMTGNVMIPADLNFARKIGDIVAFANPPFEARVFYAALCVCAIQIPVFFISRDFRFPVRVRIFKLGILGAAVFFLFFSHYSREKILPVFDIDISTREGINHLYETDGALMGFYTLCFANATEAPADYSREYMQKLAGRVRENSLPQVIAEGIRPNVIIIMSEAFTDPSRLPNVTYSEDPVPNLRMLSGKSASGYIVSPSFGGMTCNPEYELLTGNSMRYSGYGDTPYYSGEVYMDNTDGRSLPSMFKNNGYKTVGLHTNTVTFYDRNEHYPKLGFDEFIGSEMMPDAKYKGSLPDQELISDEYFMDKLLEIAENTEEPLFLFGVTMQNHSAYLPDKYESMVIKAQSGLLTDEDTACLEAYLEGVRDMDTQLGRLYEYVMESHEPYIVAFFGDHLPIITQNTGVYNELGYIEGFELAALTTDEAYKMYTTPYVVFSNYKELPDSWGNISPYFLGALTADMAGVEKNLYYNFLLQAYGCFHAMTDKLFVDNDGTVYPEARAKDEDIIKMFHAFQYDKLFGENYAGELQWK